jgi:hypothetical protein
VGDERCEPFDHMVAIHFRDVNDDDLIRWRECYDAETVAIEAAQPVTDRGLSEVRNVHWVKRFTIRHGNFTSKGNRHESPARR